MKEARIVFLGGGNMARAIVSGLIQDAYPASKITVIDHKPTTCQGFITQYGVQASTSLDLSLATADILILAVKPQDAQAACLPMQEAFKKHAPLVISVMAGITAKTLEQWLGPQQAVIRAMPNTPAAVQCGATGLFANPYCTLTDKNQAESILRATGVISWVQNEVDLASLTALSGSGPGYYFYFMEIMEAMAIKMGIPAETAHLFTVQTAYGAAKLALESPSPFAALRAQVSSGGGSTAAAIASMQHHDLTNLLEEAMIACRNRALELAQGS